MTLLGHASKNQGHQQQEVREARRLLRERIRNDWDYPSLPAFKSTGRERKVRDSDVVEEERVAGFRFHAPQEQDEAGKFTIDALEWRARECSSESDMSDDESVASSSSKGSSPSKTSGYKFDRPDSVGVQIQGRRTARKRKRQKDLEEEMGWNEGLAHWMSRRDAWCGAHTAAQVHDLEVKHHTTQNGSQPGQTSPTSARSSESEPRTSTSSNATVGASSSTVTTPEIYADTSQLPPPPASATAPQSEVLIPVTAPILQNHPIKRRISPAMYNEIYTKIILQSRTPSVPINLLTLIAALVQGWKDDGEWPPRVGPLEPSIGKRRSRGSHGSDTVKNGIKSVGRVLRLTGTGEASAQRRPSRDAG
ncbi:hypothetical protein KC316_g7101 [Hortaea werneckii]|uniref:Gag1-like clamp domain-containing protein n=1 Tax=Hortaea werneckii TaxID=91943 RepID=A0A3M6XQQ2_HORWE|nr:hypothetical protein KC316_g7101 [Hortaea werneckii]RMX93133.1 hypothetical protein D0868_13024 [Hortaea werneckii]